MNWTELGNNIVTFGDDVTTWINTNPVESEVSIVLLIVGSVYLLATADQRKRSKMMRLIRGSMMKRKDREKYHKMRIEDAIVDVCMEMVQHGDMTPEQERQTYIKMAKSYDLTGLIPGKSQEAVKRAVNFRLLRGWFARKIPHPSWGGAKPGEGVQVDPNYKPEFGIERRGLNTSKYLKET